MTAKQKNIEIGRALYVAGKGLDDIAQICSVTRRTVSNWKRDDTEDWDVLRAAKHIGEADGDRQHLYANFMGYMHDSIAEIRAAEGMTPAQKTDSLVKLGDSFAKMNAIARKEDPKAFVLGVIKHVVKTIGDHIMSRGDQALIEAYADAVTAVQDELDVAI